MRAPAALALLAFAAAAPAGAAARGPADSRHAPAQGCGLTASHTQDPPEIRLGETAHVVVTLDVDCPAEELGRQFVLGLPAWALAADSDAARDAARAFVAEATQRGLKVGLTLGHTNPPTEVPPTLDAARLDAALVGYGPSAAGASTAVLVGSARAVQFDGATEGVQHIVVLDHAAAVHSSESRLRFEMNATIDLGMEVTHVCVGAGPCPPAPGAEALTAGTQAALVTALDELAGRPAPMGFRWATVRQNLGAAVDYVHPSANLRPARMGSSPDANFIEWLSERPQDQVVYEFDIRPFAVGSVSAVAELEVEGLTNLGARASFVAPPLAPIVVRPEPARPSTCSLRASAEASSYRVSLRDPVTATLTLLTDCPPALRDVDVVLAFDQSRSMEGLPVEAIVAAAERFIDRVRLDRSRVAIMTFSSSVDMRTGLIQDRAALIDALQPMTYGGETELALAIDSARAVLEERRPTAMPALVLLTDGAVRDDPLPAAAWAKAEGIRVAVVCFSPTLACDDEVFEVASTQYLFLARDASELLDAYDALGSYMAQPDVQRLSVSLEPSPGLEYNPGAAHPDPPARGADGALVWNRAEPLQGAAELRLPLSAVGIGSWPLADSAAAYYVDSDGGVGAVSIPLPRVEVVPPAPTGPCTPAGSRSVEPERVDLGGDVTVASRLDVTCAPSDAPLDVVFAIDHSFSMGALNRLPNAVAAVDEFLAATDGTGAWHGLVAFNEAVTHRVPLAADPTNLRAVLANLQPDGGTDIGRAMETTLAELVAGRTGARQVMVVLTDGDNSASGTPILDAAARAKEVGVLVVTVCAGGECDPDLAGAATSPEFAFSVDDASDLGDVFHRLARVVTRVDAAAIELEETIAAGFSFQSGSPEPEIVPWDPRVRLWSIGAPGENGALVAHVLRTERRGKHPVSLLSLVRYTLDGGASGEFYLPGVPVEVDGGEAPTLPTAQPVPPESTPRTGSWHAYIPTSAVP